MSERTARTWVLYVCPDCGMCAAFVEDIRHPAACLTISDPERVRVVESPARERVTHGRHCSCSACAAQDWSEPQLAPCGMHGPSCPPRYAPYGRARELVESPCLDTELQAANAELLDAARFVCRELDSKFVGKRHRVLARLSSAIFRVDNAGAASASPAPDAGREAITLVEELTNALKREARDAPIPYEERKLLEESADNWLRERLAAAGVEPEPCATCGGTGRTGASDTDAVERKEGDASCAGPSGTPNASDRAPASSDAGASNIEAATGAVETLMALVAENERLRKAHDGMYQRALDAEAHARFGPMDVDERVRSLRALVDQSEAENERLRAEKDEARTEAADSLRILGRHTSAQVELVNRLGSAEAEARWMRQELFDCYVQAGADTDGDGPEHVVKPGYVLGAVRELRADCDECPTEDLRAAEGGNDE